jgi:hypothetical protein
MHQFARADNGVHRACIDALAATDTECFVDDSTGARFVHAVPRVQRFGWEMQQRGQCLNGDIAARRALIDAGGVLD